MGGGVKETRITGYSARATITKYHRLDGLYNRNIFSHSCGCWKSKIKVLGSLVSPETSLLGLQVDTCSLCPHMAFLCVRISLVSPVS